MTARQFGREGLRALEQGDNARADEALSTAIEAHDAPTLRLARGRARSALGRMLAAKEDYAMAARWPQRASDAAAFQQARRQAAEALAAIESQIPRLTVEFHGDGKVEVSGVEWPRDALGTPHPLDPGEYIVQVVAERGVVTRMRVRLLPGDHETAVLDALRDASSVAPLDQSRSQAGLEAEPAQGAAAQSPSAAADVASEAKAPHALPRRATAASTQCAPAFCNNLGLIYANGAGVTKDQRYAAALYTKACDAGVAAGCNNLARQYSQGKGVLRDAAYAAELYAKACDRGLKTACTNLALLHLQGMGVKQDLARAVELLADACAGEEPRACANLGSLYQHGTGVPEDLERAAELFTGACKRENPAGCNNLGLLYEHGRGVPRDRTRALELFQRACDADDEPGCRNAQRLESGLK